MDERKTAGTALALVVAFALGFALTVNIPVMFNNFLNADQAVYFSMAQSIARDGDLEWTKKDLLRYREVIEAGPMGIFLKRGKDGRIFFAKSFAYSLLAAPFVRLFGINGAYVLHALLLGLILLCGWKFLALGDRPGRALAGVLTFLFASVAGFYFIWITPDFFNLSLVFVILFLALYKVRRAETASPDAGPPPGRLERFLLSNGSDYLAAFLAGIAIFSKPPNVVLLAPLVLRPFLAKKYKTTALVLLFTLASAVFLFGMNYLLTSDWNFMGGERKTFYYNYPLEKAGVTFDSTGSVMTSEGYFEKMLIPPQYILLNVFYYFFGRFTGLAWYFFPALAALALFFRGAGRKRPWQWLVFLALAAEILIYVVLMPTNYGGGGGSIANRYFLNIFPLFFFLPGARIRTRDLVLPWLMAAAFLSPILVAPFTASANPATHAKRFPFKALPIEMPQVNEWPTNTNPNAFRIPIGTPPRDGLLHFLDDNYIKKSEPDGIWTHGDRTAEMVLKTYFPVSKIVVRVMNNPRRENKIRVSVDGRAQKVVLGPREKAALEFPVGPGFHLQTAWLHRLKIGAAKGAIPYYEDEESLERRYLGVFFSLELVAAE